jgi:hypothetical protein
MQVLDVRWDYSVASRLGNTMPSYVGLSAKERATDENVKYAPAAHQLAHSLTTTKLLTDF